MVRGAVRSVRIRDEVLGAPDVKLELELESADLTVGELISGRVTAEFARGAERTAYRPLVQWSADETLLNRPRRQPAVPELEEAVDRALAAFTAGRFVILIDGRQVSSCEEEVRLTPSSEVTFVRLLPLRGG